MLLNTASAEALPVGPLLLIFAPEKVEVGT
jgi:hypothetical protein